MRIYLSGPIRGVSDFRERFERAARDVRKMGHTPVNPVENPFDRGNLREIMRYDLYLETTSDAIYMLPGWSNSGGAKIEHALAVYLGMDVFYQLEQIPDESEPES